MAPQQELESLISPLADSGGSDESVHGDDAHVIVVQPQQQSDFVGKKSKLHGNNGKWEKKGKGGEGEPRNCRHIETVLFFFGIAGMIVSIVMLLQHLLIRYY